MLVPVSFMGLLLSAYSLPQEAPSSTNVLTGIMNAITGRKSVNETNFFSMVQMPSCLKQCVPQMDKISQLVAGDPKDVDLKQLCKEMQVSSLCAARAGCSLPFMDAVTNVFQMMCLDNMDSVSQSLECVMAASDTLQQECENHCGVQAGLIEKAQRNHLDEMFDVSSVCNYTVCLLHCFKDRVSTKCMAQNNVIENLLNSVLRGEGGKFDEMISWTMPDICRNTLVEVKPSTDSNTDSPLSVGAPTRAKKMIPSNRVSSESDTPLSYINGTMETALLIDGEVRALRCTMMDVDGNQTPMPDFQSFARVMAAQILPFSMQTERTIVPAEQDVSDAEDRVQNRVASEENGDVPAWRAENEEFMVPQNGMIENLYMPVCTIIVAIYFYN